MTATLTPTLWSRVLEKLDPAPSLRDVFEVDYETWLQKMFPLYCSSPLAEHHHELWRWGWDMPEHDRPEAMVAILGRGGAKSTTAELMVAALGCRSRRKYGWYVSRSQPQADDHVGNIAAMLESATIAEHYPEMGEKLLGKFGDSKGWRRNRLRTSSGFTVDALGLDTARRGGKLEEQRPDFIILDDIDDSEDSPKVVRKLIRLITKSIIPSGAENLAILAIQNLIHPNGVFARLANGQADYLRRRKVIGPIPALTNFAYEQNEDGTYAITSGEPTWEGFGVQRCEDLLNEIGPKAFREECLHDVAHVDGAKWSREQIDSSMRVAEHPDLIKFRIAVDPSGGDGEDNDEQGIIAGGLGSDGKLYITEDVSCKMQPHGWGGRAVSAYHRNEADKVIGERNFGGDMVESTIKAVDAHVAYEDVHASRGKIARIDPVAALCGDPMKPETWLHGRIKLVGSFPELEDEMTNWSDDAGWSPNRLDALAWLAHSLILDVKEKPKLRYRG